MIEMTTEIPVMAKVAGASASFPLWRITGNIYFVNVIRKKAGILRYKNTIAIRDLSLLEGVVMKSINFSIGNIYSIYSVDK